MKHIAAHLSLQVTSGTTEIKGSITLITCVIKQEEQECDWFHLFKPSHPITPQPSSGLTYLLRPQLSGWDLSFIVELHHLQPSKSISSKK
jgi:hypothetical protein